MIHKGHNKNDSESDTLISGDEDILSIKTETMANTSSTSTINTSPSATKNIQQRNSVVTI